MDDFTVEHDKAAGQFLLTAKTDRGRDWLEGWLEDFASASSEFWGKSLIVKIDDVDRVLDLIESNGLSTYRIG